MNSRIDKSVCMSTYNGGFYVKEQILSILDNLSSNDELIIVDDCSTDETRNIICEFNDNRVKLICNSINVGVNRSFEIALRNSSNYYIFMSDQDDIWPRNRINKMISKFEENNNLLVNGNSEFFVNDAVEVPHNYLVNLKEKDSRKKILNIIKMFLGKLNYFGCNMALKRSLLIICLPFPSYIESHDLWIAMCAILLNANMNIPDVTLFRRIHLNNSSIKKRPLYKKIISRFIFLISLAEIYKRILIYKLRNQKDVNI